VPGVALAAIAAASLAPVPEPPLDGAWKHAPHAVAYALFTGTLFGAFAMRARPGRLGVGAAIAIAAFAIVFGVAMEVAQGFVGRDVERGDVAADVLGVAVVLLPWFVARGLALARGAAGRRRE
jgi:VanZ family protein